MLEWTLLPLTLILLELVANFVTLVPVLGPTST